MAGPLLPKGLVRSKINQISQNSGAVHITLASSIKRKSWPLTYSKTIHIHSEALMEVIPTEHGLIEGYGGGINGGIGVETTQIEPIKDDIGIETTSIGDSGTAG